LSPFQGMTVSINIGGYEVMKDKKKSFAEKHGPEMRAGKEAIEAVLREAKDGKLTCAKAFKLAEEIGVPPSELGLAADLKDISIVKCQLGLYGYGPKGKKVSPASSVAPNIKEAIKAGLLEGRLPCKKAWDIASENGVGKMDISSACEALGIKISRCQLGAF